jgi:hypothetical protein
MRRIAFVLVIPLLLPPGPASLRAQGSEDDAEWLARCERDEYGDDHETSCEVVVESVEAPAATIAFDGGRNGGVAFQGWDQDRMEVHARIQAHADTEEEARAIARAVRIELTPGGGRAFGPGGEEWTIVYYVYVPRQRNLEGTSNNGPLSARGVTGRIRLETRNGPIHLADVGGDVYARAQNGPIGVKLRGTRWDGEGLDAETRNGPISISIPAGYSAVLETGTEHGPFETDIPLQVTLGPGESTRRFRAELGGGGPLVRVVTTNGPVSIRSD